MSSRRRGNLAMDLDEDASVDPSGGFLVDVSDTATGLPVGIRRQDGSNHRDGSSSTEAQTASSDTLSDLWVLVPLSVLESNAAATAEGRLQLPPNCPEGYEHDSPHSAFENSILRRAMEEARAGRALLPLGPPDWI